MKKTLIKTGTPAKPENKKLAGSGGHGQKLSKRAASNDSGTGSKGKITNNNSHHTPSSFAQVAKQAHMTVKKKVDLAVSSLERAEALQEKRAKRRKLADGGKTIEGELSEELMEFYPDQQSREKAIATALKSRNLGVNPTSISLRGSSLSLDYSRCIDNEVVQKTLESLLNKGLTLLMHDAKGKCNVIKFSLMQEKLVYAPNSYPSSETPIVLRSEAGFHATKLEWVEALRKWGRRLPYDVIGSVENVLVDGFDFGRVQLSMYYQNNEGIYSLPPQHLMVNGHRQWMANVNFCANCSQVGHLDGWCVQKKRDMLTKANELAATKKLKRDNKKAKAAGSEQSDNEANVGDPDAMDAEGEWHTVGKDGKKRKKNQRDSVASSSVRNFIVSQEFLTTIILGGRCLGYSYLILCFVCFFTCLNKYIFTSKTFSSIRGLPP